MAPLAHDMERLMAKWTMILLGTGLILAGFGWFRSRHRGLIPPMKLSKERLEMLCKLEDTWPY